MQASLPDPTTTRDVIYAAVFRMNRPLDKQEVNRICDYLVTKHWFQTAYDLRVARSTHEWQSLEIPLRLKIAIQEVLDEAHPATSIDPNTCQEPVEQEQQACANTDGTGEWIYSPDYGWYYQYPDHTIWYGETSTGTEGYYQYYSDASDSLHSASAQSSPSRSPLRTAVTDDSVTKEGHWDNWDLGQWKNSQDEDTLPDHQCLAVAPTHVDSIQTNVEPSNTSESTTTPIQSDQAQTTLQPVSDSTWSCSQCTFVNSMDESFCDACYNHISLSVDLDGDSVSIPYHKVLARTQSLPSYSVALESDDMPPPSPAPTENLYPQIYPSAPPLELFNGQVTEVDGGNRRSSLFKTKSLCEQHVKPVESNMDYLAMAFNRPPSPVKGTQSTVNAVATDAKHQTKRKLFS